MELPASPLLQRDLHLNGRGKHSLLRKGWRGGGGVGRQFTCQHPILKSRSSTSSASPVHRTTVTFSHHWFVSSLLWGDFYEQIANLSLLQKGSLYIGISEVNFKPKCRRLHKFNLAQSKWFHHSTKLPSSYTCVLFVIHFAYDFLVISYYSPALRCTS